MTNATFADRINSELELADHPIIPVILDAGGVQAMTACVMYKNGHFNWCNSVLAADRPGGSFNWSRIGVNLYNHKTGHSHGAVFEFDGPSHDGGLTADQIEQVVSACERIGYVLAVWSTGGGGIHVFILWDRPISATPGEHRLLCKRASVKFCQDAGIPTDWVDVTSNVLWIATDDPQPKTFEVISEATERLDPDELPAVPVIPHTKHGDIPDIRPADKELIEDIREARYYAEWQPDIGAIHCHKKGLEAVQHKYPGRFGTVSPGSDPSSPNCWLRFDEDTGGWWVYSWQERESGWEKSPGGFTRARFGVALSFHDANTGTPENRSSYRYDNADDAIDAIRALTGHVLIVPEELRDHQFSVVSKGDVYRIHAHKLRSDEPCPAGWHRGKGYWWTAARAEGIVTKLTPAAVRNQLWQTSQNKRLTGMYRFKGKGAACRVSRPEAASIIRHLLGGDDPTSIIDDVTANEVELVCEAFQPVLQPGKVNVGPQLIVEPAPGQCRTWLRMLARLGQSLTSVLRESNWAQANGITTGGRYLLLWCGFLFQSPRVRVPGIAIVGPGESGKSTLGDALAETMDEGGVTDAGELLRKGSQFTGQVVCSLVGRIEELNVAKKSNRDRLNSWITAPYLWAEYKGETPFRVPNHLRILMTCNDPRNIPVYDQESRFTVVEIGNLERRDPEFAEKLQKERAAFVHLCQSLTLPKPVERLGLLPIDTDAKGQIAENNQTPIERFASESLQVAGDGFLTNAAVFNAYKKWCQTTGTIRTAEDSAALAHELSEWYSMRGVAAKRTNDGRGRIGLTLTA